MVQTKPWIIKSLDLKCTPKAHVLFHVQAHPFPAGSLLSNYHLLRDWERGRPEDRRILKATWSSTDNRNGNMHLLWKRIQGVPIFKNNILQFTCQLFGIRIYFPSEIMLQSRHTPKSHLICFVEYSVDIEVWNKKKIGENSAVAIIIIKKF